jgi:hypothetical protein
MGGYFGSFRMDVYPYHWTTLARIHACRSLAAMIVYLRQRSVPPPAGEAGKSRGANRRGHAHALGNPHLLRLAAIWAGFPSDCRLVCFIRANAGYAECGQWRRRHFPHPNRTMLLAPAAELRTGEHVAHPMRQQPQVVAECPDPDPRNGWPLPSRAKSNSGLPCATLPLPNTLLGHQHGQMPFDSPALLPSHVPFPQ